MASTATTAPSSASSPSISSPPASSASAAPSASSKQRATPNGVSNRPRSQNEPKTTLTPGSTSESNTPNKHAHDRLLFLVANFVGQIATLTVQNGDQYSGVFSGASLDSNESQYVLKMVKRVSPAQTNGYSDELEEYVGTGEDYTMGFDLKDVVDLHVANVSTDRAQAKLTNGSTTSFRTDTDISGNLTLRERELQRWEPAPDSNLDLALNGGGGPGWDQFETNERLYGVRTDYDESFYTTTIDRSHPSYKQRVAEADRLAREIEGSTSTNAHVAEERGIVEDFDEEDEESKFSGVKRDFPSLPPSQPNKYTPPARRAPTGQATVAGAPVDPAIISSQLARPDTSPKPPEPDAFKNDNEDPRSKINAALKSPALPAPVDGENTQTENQTSSTSGGAARGTHNTTANVENEVLASYKSWVGSEKLRVQEKQRQSARKEKEVKLNDLKKFSLNFKLKTAVPTDMLGILAKDRFKQDEIVEKSQRQLEEQQNSTTKAISPEQMTPKPAVTTRPDGAPTSPVASADRAAKAPRNVPQNFHTVRGDRSMQNPNMPLVSPRAGPGNLGPRLMAHQQQQQQQYRDRPGQNFTGQYPMQDPKMMPPAPAPISTGSSTPGAGGIETPTSAASSRFNAQAMEFRPNPTATTFQPSGEQSRNTSSPARSAKGSISINRVNFFGDKRPRPSSERRSIRDDFNPIIRMKKEIIDQKKSKEFAANGGIPQAYRTPPTWDATEENKEKSYIDMFEKPPSSTPSVSPGNSMPHQHQLPLHLQQGAQPIPHVQTPNQNHGMPPQFPQHQGRDNHFDDHRMGFSSSNSSVFPSPTPRFQQPMMAYPNHMAGQMPPPFAQAQFSMSPNGHPMGPVRQFSASGSFAHPQGGHPMMHNNSSGGSSFIGVPMQQQMPMYSPGQTHAIPAHMGGHHGPTGPSGYPSPGPSRTPMMVQQGSQQGHAPQQYVYLNTGQHPPQMFPQQPAGPMPHMRGGIPMTHQHSYGSSPHFQQGFPAQHRAQMQFGGNYGPQPMHQTHNFAHPNQSTGGHMSRGGNDGEDIK